DLFDLVAVVQTVDPRRDLDTYLFERELVQYALHDVIYILPGKLHTVDRYYRGVIFLRQPLSEFYHTLGTRLDAVEQYYERFFKRGKLARHPLLRVYIIL